MKSLVSKEVILNDLYDLLCENNAVEEVKEILNWYVNSKQFESQIKAYEQTLVEETYKVITLARR